jgi:hypothetical protein
MRIKSVTLYSLPLVVGIASFLVTAHQVAPSLTLSDTSTRSAIIFHQVVNRSLKSDRLPIKQTVPQANVPNRKIKNDCNKPPIDVIGRCFADAGPLRHDLLL